MPILLGRAHDSNVQHSHLRVFRPMEMQSNSTNFTQGRVAAFGILNHVQKTIENCCATYSLNESSACEYYDRGLEQYERGNLEHALVDFTSAVRLNPTFEQAFNARGSVYGDLGQDTLALRDFDEAIRLAPDRTLAYSNRAVILYKYGHIYRALQDMNHDIAITGDAKAYVKRASLFNIIKMHEQAISDCSIALTLEPNTYFALLVRGQAHLALHQFEQCVDDLTRCLDVDPKSAMAYWLRSYAHAWLKNEKLAEEDYHRAIQLDPLLANLSVVN